MIQPEWLVNAGRLYSTEVLGTLWPKFLKKLVSGNTLNHHHSCLWLFLHYSPKPDRLYSRQGRNLVTRCALGDSQASVSLFERGWLFESAGTARGAWPHRSGCRRLCTPRKTKAMCGAPGHCLAYYSSDSRRAVLGQQTVSVRELLRKRKDIKKK